MRLLHSRHRRRLITLSVSGMVLPGILLSVLAWRLLQDFERLERRNWQEYGESLQQSSVRQIERQLWDDEQRLMVGVRVSPPASDRDAVSLLGRIEADHPLYREARLVNADGVVFGPDGQVGLDAGQDRQAASSPPLARAIAVALDVISGEREGPAPFHHLSGEADGRPYQITYFTIRNENGQLDGALILLWDLDYLSTTYLPALLAAGPPAMPPVVSSSLLDARVDVTVLDEQGRPLFTTALPAAPGAPGPREGLRVARPFQTVLGFWRLAVDLDNHAFESWMRSVRITHLALIGGMIGLILITAFFLIRWLTREIEYADLKTSFVSNVSHELKTPLALIRLYAETLELDRCGDAEQRRSCLQTISRESDRLTRLIDNVLDLSRIESGAMRYRLERTDITTVVDETLDAYRYHLDEQGFRVELDLVERPLVARVDAGALTQALVNLLDNAVKYSREVKEITVACRREGACALVSVRDRGEGIDREELPRIFETFYRGSGNGDAPAPGFGLGLALVHHIAAAHGGRVRVESHVGEGSTFTLELPLADGAALYRR